ncbi:hypothetical protein D0Z07_0791 [Hyphodiscus hymeniophilus]|uniref:Histidine acid phosphatase n=1 Tax=Hyphodiscus hymeniophilus TaxID=353542 RepID=A0A9P6VP49_9HELO|nr:hypothetical protein D0Z07_0791 [Hyphodiscus hymeniophilus]
MVSLIFGLLGVAPSIVSALTPLQSFYPPNLNDTSYITDLSLGTYGGTYQSPTREPNTTLPYGSYDYCQMPHPRVREYPLPEAVRNGSVKANIVYLEYLQRHQRRTPYNILPGGENQPYDCDDILPYLYAGPASGEGPLPVYAQTYTDITNPFVLGYVNGSCQFPQLTIGGLLDGYQHGKDIWAVYGAKLGLIPIIPEKEKVWFRSTESPLTQQSAGGVLRGVWPAWPGALPLHQQTSAVDTVNEGFSCSNRGTVLSAIESTAEWNEHLNVTANLRSELGSMFGATSSDWQDTFDHFSDNFQGRLCNGYKLPCDFSDTSKCVSMEQANEVFRAGDWEWNYYWRTNPKVQEYIQLVQGVFIGEILSHFQAIIDGKTSLVYSHIFVHDGDIGPVLGALGITQLRWPAMASNIAFEIWRTEGRESALFARVLYCGQPVETIHGTLDWLPLESLIAILKPYVPTDIVSLCNA